MKKKIILALSVFAIFAPCSGADSIPSPSSNPYLQPYIAPKSFETRNLKLEAIDTAEKDTACYQAIYQDSGWRNSWFSGVCGNFLWLYTPGSIPLEYIKQLEEEGIEPISKADHDLIQKRDIEFFQRKEALGVYNSKSFYDYLIRDKETQEVAGRFIFCGYEKDGRIEKGIYLLNKFRGKGYGSEVLTGVLTSVVKPAIGKPFSIIRQNVSTSPETRIYPSFKGVFSKISPWYNYPSVSASFKAGCAIRWMGHRPITFYPTGDNSCLNPSNELQSFLNIIRLAHVISTELSFGDTKEQFFHLMKNQTDEIKDTLMDDLYTLVDYGDDSTAEFAQNALNILEEEFSNSAESESTED